MKIFSLLKTQKWMLLNQLLPKKCFANQVRRDSAHSIVSVMHIEYDRPAWLKAASVYIYIKNMCMRVCMCLCVCVAQLMLAESFCVVNRNIIVKSRFASWQTSICQRPSLLSSLPGTFVHSHTQTYLVCWFLANPMDTCNLCSQDICQPASHNVSCTFLQAEKKKK